MRWAQQKSVIASFGLAVSLLAAASFIAYRNSRQRIDADHRVAHAHEVVAGLEAILADLDDAETAQRGYIVTGDETFLEPYHRALPDISRAIQHVREMSADDAGLQERVADLESRTQSRLALIDRGIRLRRVEGFEKARLFLLSGQGKVEMDGIRLLIAEMEAEETSLLQQRSEKSTADTRIAMRSVGLVALLALGVLALVFFLLCREVIRRKQSEALLRQSAGRFAVAVDGANDGIWDWNLETNEVYFSPRWKGMLGYEGHEILDRLEEWEKRLHPEDREQALAALKDYLSGDASVYENEHRLLHKNGKYRWFLCRGKSLRGPGGKAYRMAGTLTDISERKRAEAVLQRQATLLDQTYDAILAWELDGAIVYWNRGAERVYGIPPGNAVGRVSHDLLHTVFPGTLRECKEALTRTGRWEGTLDHQTHHGRRIYVESRMTLVPEGGVNLVLESNRDITKRKRAEEERDRFFTLPLEMLCVAGFDGYFKRLNPAWERALGYSLEELLREPFLSFVHPDDRQATLAATADLHQGRNIVHFENRYRAKDGSYRWLVWSATSVVEEGTIYGAARDVTEPRLAEDRIRELNRELGRALAESQGLNKELETFSYSVSHDLRAPLRAMDGFSLALLEGHQQQLDDQGKHYLRRVREASQRMGRLIDDMLALSRVTRREVRREKIDLSRLAKSIGEELRQREPHRQVDFRVAEGAVVEGDPQLLHIAVQNLLGNAWKYTRKKEQPRIEFGIADPGFFVRDDGAGFDMKYVDKLFGVFQRLHAQTDFEGTGVGLATVQRIIHRHGGRIWAEGEINKGATFFFTLPNPEGRGEPERKYAERGVQ